MEKFFIVDAFADERFGGNPAGVVLLEGGEFPPFDLMLKTAAELRYSETVFAVKNEDNSYELRYFTPTEEVDLCGHATVAAFKVISEIDSSSYSENHNGNSTNDTKEDNKIETIIESSNIKDAINELNNSNPKNGYGCGCYYRYELDENGLPKQSEEEEMKITYKVKTKAGDIEVVTEDGSILMDMADPKDINTSPDLEKISEIYDALSLKMADHLVNDDLTPEIISTGLPDIMLPVNSIDALNSITPDFDRLSDLIEGFDAVSVHAFCIVENHEPNGEKLPFIVHCRNFAPNVGIPEEAATGTSNGALTWYLFKRGMINPESINLFIQGEAMDRPSEIQSMVVMNEDDSNLKTKIKVGGNAFILANGKINI